MPNNDLERASLLAADVTRRFDELRDQITAVSESFRAQLKSVTDSINSNNTMFLRDLLSLQKDFAAHEKADNDRHEREDLANGKRDLSLEELQDVRKQGKGVIWVLGIAWVCLTALIGWHLSGSH